jgi:hypothetical protein
MTPTANNYPTANLVSRDSTPAHRNNAAPPNHKSSPSPAYAPPPPVRLCWCAADPSVLGHRRSVSAGLPPLVHSRWLPAGRIHVATAHAEPYFEVQVSRSTTTPHGYSPEEILSTSPPNSPSLCIRFWPCTESPCGLI